MVTDHNFLLADAHPGSPSLSAENYAYEEQAIPLQLRGVRRGLQVGCMNGTRVVRFSKAAPHAHIDGIEISETSVAIARRNVAEAGLDATILLGDITNPPPLLQPKSYDLVYALNNTLGYIPDIQRALDTMRMLSADKVVLSLFSDERFTNDVALSYFGSMDIDPKGVEIDGNTFYVPDADGKLTTIRRFSRDEVLRWGGKIKETPLGFYVVLSAAADLEKVDPAL